MRFFTIKLICLILFFPLCSKAQIIRYGQVYGDNGSTDQWALHSTIDKTGGRYTLVSYYSNFIVDSAGTPVTITSIPDNGIGCHGGTLAILKFDSTGRYEYHCKIQAYLSHVCADGSSNVIMRIDPSNQLTFCATMGDFDSVDLVDSKGSLYKRIVTPNAQDSTFIFIGKLTSDGQFQWMNTISRITQMSPIVPSYVPFVAVFKFTKEVNTFTINDAGESKVDLDLYELYQPYTADTLLLTYDNGSTIPVYVQGQDIRLTFSNTGLLLNNVAPFPLKVNNTADHMEVLRTMCDGNNIYSLLRIRLDSKDTLIAPSPLALDTGYNILLVKSDNKDSIVWARFIGRGDAYNFNLDYDNSIRQVNVGFYYLNYMHPWYTTNTSIPFDSTSYGATYLAKFDSWGNITWNNTYGNRYDYINIISSSFNPVNHGLILIGRVEGYSSSVRIENFILPKKPFKPYYFIALFDSLNQCLEAETIRSTDHLGIDNLYPIGLYEVVWNGSPITDQRGRTYISGTFLDSIGIACDRFIYAAPSPQGSHDAFVLVTNPPPSYKDTSVCNHMLSPSGKYTYDSTGIYWDTLTPVANCDSIVIIKLTVLHTKSTFDTAVCARYITPSGKYQVDSNATLFDTIPNHRGCDSIMTIHVFLLRTQSTIDTSLCDHYISPSNKYTVDTSMTIFDTIPNARGCDSVMIIHVHILLNNAEIDTSVCDRLLSPSTRYTWNSDGKYVDTIPNAAGCDSIITIHLTINQSSSTIDTTYCGDLVSPSGKYTYTVAGTYLDFIPNMKGCDSLITIRFKKSDMTSTVPIHSCSAVTSPSGKYQYNTSGTYTDTILSLQLCDSIITLDVIIDSLVIKASKSNDITCDTPFAMLSVNKGTFFTWAPQNLLNDAHSRNPIATPTQKTIFYIQAKDSFGCVANDSIELDVNKKETISDLSNVFTPNNDGINDCLSLQSITSLKSLSFTIFNRWGTIVFQSANPHDCWNGKNLSGQDVSDGVYYFILTGVSICDTQITQNGTIELIR